MRSTSSVPVRAAALAVSALAFVVAASCSLVSGLDDIQIADDGGGAHRTCSAATQCDDENPCTADACGPDGLCVWTSLDGVPSPAQIVGDCQTAHCVQGKAQTDTDDTDIPDDHEECTIDTCNAGMPAHTAKPDETPCGPPGSPGACKNGKCAAGDCTAHPSVCPSMGPCATVSCSAATGMCEYTPLPDGTPTPGTTQVAGDCQVHICVAGMDTPAVDDSDVPVTPTDCDTEICTNGAPSNPPKTADTPCSTFNVNQPGFCDGMGACVECSKDSECHGPDPNDNCQARSCLAGACGPYTVSGTVAAGQFQTTGDCLQVVCDGLGGHMAIANANDPTNDGNACTADACSGTMTVHTPLAAGTSCGAGGIVCNATGQCGCQNPGDCTAPNTCGGGNPGTPMVCGCTKKTCGMVGATCGTPSDGCFATLNCNDGTKNGTETDIDCGGGGNCATKCVNGKKCGIAGDCASGFCVDGVCCGSVCNGLCQACSALKKGSGTDGACGPIKAGADPDNECALQAVCAQNGFCDGTGACQLFASGTTCVAASCVGTVLNKTDTCNGSGTCVDGGTQDCSPYNCVAAACLATCAADSDCAATAYCAAPTCLAKKMTSAMCAANHECISGMCVSMKCQ